MGPGSCFCVCIVPVWWKDKVGGGHGSESSRGEWGFLSTCSQKDGTEGLALGLRRKTKGFWDWGPKDGFRKAWICPDALRVGRAALEASFLLSLELPQKFSWSHSLQYIPKRAFLSSSLLLTPSSCPFPPTNLPQVTSLISAPGGKPALTLRTPLPITLH